MKRAFAILLASLVAATTADASLVIDDFEKGEFYNHQTGGGSHGEVVNLGFPFPHCFRRFRVVWVSGGSSLGQGTASLSTTPAEDAIVFDAIRDGWVSLNYLQQSNEVVADLTQGGTLDRMQVYLSSVISGGWVSVSLYDDAGGADTTTTTVTTPGPVNFPLANFQVDVTRVRDVILKFRANNNSGRFEIRDVRCLRTDSHVVTFTPEILDFQFPPLPSPPCMFAVVDPIESLLFLVNQSVVSASTGEFIPAMEGLLLPAVAPEGPMTLACTWDDARPVADTDFEMLLEINPLGGPAEPSTAGLSSAADGFAVTIPIILQNADHFGSSILNVTYEPAPGQGIVLEGASIAPASLRGGPTTTWNVSFHMTVVGNVDEGEPLFTATWHGDWVAGPGATSAPLAAVERTGLSLLVQPSVTRDGTEIRFGSPRTLPATLHVVDICGRRVARQDVPVGATSIAWSGRAADGAPTPAGVYFLRVSDPTSTATGRVTRIR